MLVGWTVKHNTREQLIKAASRLFSERGFDGVSIRDIVRATSANLGAVTYHFGSKEDLFEEVLQRKIAPMRDLGRKIASANIAPEEKLRRMFEVYAYHVLNTDPSLKVLFAELIHGGRRLSQESVNSVKWRNRIFGNVINEGVRAGRFRKCDVEILAWEFFGMLSSFILYEPLMSNRKRSGAYPKSYVKRIVDSAMDLSLYGIMAPGVARQKRHKA